MKIATWNVNGIRAREAQLRDFLERERPDVVCLQEIKATPAQVPGLLLDPGGYWAYWHGASAYSGVALHVRRELAPTSASSSGGSSAVAWWTSGATCTPTMTPSSPGGRPGGTCANATSAGASITCWRARRWRRR